MASTASNKLPLLIDRPINRVRRLDRTSSTATADPGTGTNGVLLVSCLNNEGALVEDIWLIQRVVNDRTLVNLYLSTSEVSLGVTSAGGQADSFFMGQGQMASNAAVGQYQSLQLPLLLAPVPHATGQSSNILTPQFRGLRVEKGWALWAAADGAGPHLDAPNIGIQGGFY